MMNDPASWLIKILLAHLLTDFLLQPKSWIESRERKHFRSGAVYLHGFVTALFAFAFTGFRNWIIAIVILITHTGIDIWKSYQKKETKYFVIDQLLHLLVIGVCWYFLFFHLSDLKQTWQVLDTRQNWVYVTAYFFITQPASIIIGQLTKKWREQIADGVSLGNAGKWIGILERVIILSLVINDQYETIGLLVAAKGLLRFNEANRPEVKTEYLLIGTLISISLSVIVGLLVIRGVTHF